MSKIYDNRELEYFNMLLEKWIKNNPTLDIMEEVAKQIIYNEDVKAKKNDSLYLNSIYEQIPNSIIKIMVERMEEIKKQGATKYAMYRACEDYLCKTDWFFNLPNKKQSTIRYDFYKNIILGIHKSYCRID